MRRVILTIVLLLVATQAHALPVLPSQGDTGAFYHARTGAGSWNQMTYNVDLSQAVVAGVPNCCRPVPYTFGGVHDFTSFSVMDAGLYWRNGAFWPFANTSTHGWSEPGVSIPANHFVQVGLEAEPHQIRLTIRDFTDASEIIHVAPFTGVHPNNDLRWFRQSSLVVDPGQENFQDGGYWKVTMLDAHLYSNTGFTRWTSALNDSSQTGVYPDNNIVQVTLFDSGSSETVIIDQRPITEPSAFALITCGIFFLLPIAIRRRHSRRRNP